jgi:cyclopropane fatty-acyl-phospholipid synthase-like methyltransferase
MSQQSNIPQWNETDSQSFIDYGTYLVPERELQIDNICDLIPPASGQQHILDLCCGEGILTRALLDRFPEAQVLAYDGSPTMVESVKSTLRNYGNRIQTRLFDLAAGDWRTFPWPLQAVVSSLAIHHLDDLQKQQLFKDIHRLLSSGGVFINADVIQPVTPSGVTVAAKMWDEAVRQRSLQLSGDLKAYQHFLETQWNSFTLPEPDPIDKMSPLFSQLKWLEQAGFVDIDVFWVKAGHAIYGARKE